eukprot:CAMPEP_0197917028 /NCGR_PEP_ID=MMETSP1439-20131203/83066_1 /TAXON_ID=66791 /ORGANISM="Gonyaulax spinifera, Strain CCMP409" /LENGTH=80 /DNA_ID=CAMNT_0043539093 /DNA_START=10 /DNA_END=249 /DNA_ORIENTATION=-
MTPQPASIDMHAAWMASVSEPIWFTLSSRALQALQSSAFCTRVGFVTRRSSPTICMLFPTAAWNLEYAAQSSWSKGSSMD